MRVLLRIVKEKLGLDIILQLSTNIIRVKDHGLISSSKSDYLNIYSHEGCQRECKSSASFLSGPAKMLHTSIQYQFF